MVANQFTNLRSSLGGSGFDSVAETQSMSLARFQFPKPSMQPCSIQEDDDHDSSLGSTGEAAPKNRQPLNTLLLIPSLSLMTKCPKQNCSPPHHPPQNCLVKARYSSLLGDSSTLDDASTRKPSTRNCRLRIGPAVAAVDLRSQNLALYYGKNRCKTTVQLEQHCIQITTYWP